MFRKKSTEDKEEKDKKATKVLGKYRLSYSKKSASIAVCERASDVDGQHYWHPLTVYYHPGSINFLYTDGNNKIEYFLIKGIVFPEVENDFL